MGTPAPERLGPYRIVGCIGEGGMGIVFRGEHGLTGEPVALKTARSPQATQISGLRCEIHALAQIRHPGIVRIIAEGQEQGLPWYAMELLEGRTLEKYLRTTWKPRHSVDPALVHANTLATPLPGRDEPRRTPTLDSLPPSEAPILIDDDESTQPVRGPKREVCGGKLQEVLRIFKRLCGPLSFLHASGIVHRDLKPANVFLRSDGTPVLMDFGLVIRGDSGSGRERIAVAGDVTGTAAYMSPEQVMGQLGDPRTDLYALGCMLYEAVTGRLPFRSKSLQKMMLMHLDDMPEPPSEHVIGVPPPLDDLILRLLAKDTQDRLGHADDVATVLDALLDDTTTTPPPIRHGGHLYRPRMVGREDLLRQLVTHIDLLHHGQGSMVLLGGESGVGKTTLASAAAHRARVDRVTVVTGECIQLAAGHDSDAQGAPLHPFKGFFDYVADRCREHGEALAEKWLGPRGRVLAPYAPQLAGLPGQDQHPEPPEIPAQAARARLVEALRETLAAVAGERGLLLVIDDLQWADDLTVSTLAELDKAWLLFRPLFVLGTYRSEEMNDGLRELKRTPGCGAFDVARLDHATVGSIVADMLAMRQPPQPLVDTLAARSDGNPFFVAEYLRTAVAEGLLFRAYGTWTAAGQGQGPERFESLDVPASLRDLVGRRLAGLSEGARSLAEAAAVLGRMLNGDVAMHVAEATPNDALDALKELLTKQVIVEVGTGSFRFIHDKLREITYDRIDGPRRRELHRRAAEQMEGAGSTAYYELALHFTEAGEPADLDKAMRYLELAGAQARKSFANRDAVRIYSDLLALAKRVSQVTSLSLARWHRMLADAYMGLGKTVDAQTHLLEAVKLLGHPMPEGKTRLSLGLVAQALTQLVHRLRPIPATDDVDSARREHMLEAARAYDLLMPVSFYVTGDIRRILYATLANVNLAERAGPSQELALAYGNMHLTTGLVPLPGVAEAYWRRTQDVLECVSDPAVRCWICILASVYAIGIGDWARARHAAEEALAIARGVGFHRRAEEALGLIANVHVLRGEFAEALELSRSTKLSSLRGDPQTQLWGYAGEAQALVHLGRVEEALAAADSAKALLEEVTSRPERIMALGAFCAARLAAGDYAAARAAATEALVDMNKGTPTSFYCITAYSSIAETCVTIWSAARNDAELAQLMSRSLDEMKKSARVFSVHVARDLLYRARRAAGEGNEVKARRLARRSRETAEQMEMRYDVGLADALLARLSADA